MNIFNLKTVAAIATVVAATVISTTASANPFDFLNRGSQQPSATAYANPNEDQSEVRADLRRGRERGDLPCDAEDAQEVGAVGLDLDVQDRVVQAERLNEVLAGAHAFVVHH